MMLSHGLAAGLPKNKYATWDPTKKYTDVILSNGNLTAKNTTLYGSVIATIFPTTGKWYWEITVNTAPATLHTGFATSIFDVVTGYAPGRDPGGQSGGYKADGGVYASNALITSVTNYVSGDVIGVALNRTGSTIEFFKNNVSVYSGSIPAADWTAAVGAGDGIGMGQITANFGASAFNYSPPAGYNAGLY